MGNRNKLFILKQKLAGLEFVSFVRLPSLHKAAALIMLFPFILQALLMNVFVISHVEFSIPKFVNSIPMLNQIDLSYLPFSDTEFIIERINYSILIFLPVFLFAALISQWLVRKSTQKQTIQPVEAKVTTGNMTVGLDNLNREVLPVWNRQIDSARQQSEIAVKDMARQFGGISRRLNEAVQASASYANEGASNTDNQDDAATGMISHDDLEEMLETLREAIDVKSVLLDKINQLKEQTFVMKEVVSSVKAVSRKTEVLAINAAIESRRAGVHGKSFGIVAQEVRKLSEQSEKMVDDVGHHIQMLEQKMDEVISQTNMKDSDQDESAEHANKTMSLYERFRMLALSLSKSSEVLLVESSNIKNEINEILVALQYQDKTSQILIHVTDNIQSLHELLEQSLEANTYSRLDVEAWMAALYSSYTMAEEMRAHKNEQQNFEEPEDDGSSLEFF